MIGHACPGCLIGLIRCRATRKVGNTKLRYLACSDRCGWTGQQWLTLDRRGRIIHAGNLSSTVCEANNLNAADDADGDTIG